MQNYVTKDGLKRLKEELTELKTTRRKELSEKLQRAISSGDLAENAEYQEAKEEQAFVEGRINELEQTITSAIVIEEQHGTTTVKIGSTVLLERLDKGKRRDAIYTIVGSEEANPIDGKISYVSPLGAAIVGRRAGEKVEITTPAGPATWKIRAVK